MWAGKMLSIYWLYCLWILFKFSYKKLRVKVFPPARSLNGMMCLWHCMKDPSDNQVRPITGALALHCFPPPRLILLDTSMVMGFLELRITLVLSLLKGTNIEQLIVIQDERLYWQFSEIDLDFFLNQWLRLQCWPCPFSEGFWRRRLQQ